MNSKKAFNEEKSQFEIDRMRINEINNIDEIVQLNVRGVKDGFLTSKGNLVQVQDSLLSKMISGRVEIKMID